MADELTRMEFDLGPNEASGLETFHNERVLADHDWDVAFWAVLDDVDVHEAIGVIGHRHGAPLQKGWSAERLHATYPAGLGDTEDAEAVAEHGGHVYIFGSHFGSKDGPLQRKRQFVARFHEGEVRDAFGGDPIALQVKHTGLIDGLHRSVNDALQQHGIALTEPGPSVRSAFLDPDDHTPDDMRPADGDQPINIEGAEFFSNGVALLGLRWPVAADGRPIVVVVDGIPGWFTGGRRPRVTSIHLIDAIGDNGRMAGVRDLAISGGRLHLVTGNIDSRDKGSVLLTDRPDGADTVNTHFWCDLPSVEHDSELDATVVRTFPDLPRIEGLVAEFGHFFYVSDEDEGVDMRFTRFVVADDE